MHLLLLFLIILFNQFQMSSAFYRANLLNRFSRFQKISSVNNLSTKYALRSYSSSSLSLNSNNNQSAPQKITPREENFSTWFNDILTAADMVDHSPVRGFMIIKPWGMAIWDEIRSELDRRIKKTGTSNAYFPLFIPRSYLAKESEHVAGFAKECAVVTHHRLKATDDGKNLIPDPDAELAEPLVVRPTSEAIIWPTYSKWIHSYRDLPLKLNQWANVVRWELRTRPFLRTSEFLWQEGHTAHASEEEARNFTIDILHMYKNFCEKFLALPVIPGVKSNIERFAGATDTYTIESMMMNGWALQTATSHFLGQSFGQAFNVNFLNEKNEKETVWATSWGISTRLIGALLLSHSDDVGIILPPKVAPQQVVIVPVYSFKNNENEVNKDEEILKLSKDLTNYLNDNDIRCALDDRKDIRVGNKRYEWERKGVPLRIEIGVKELESNNVLASRRLALSEHTIYLNEEEKNEHLKILNDLKSSKKKNFIPTLKRNLNINSKSEFLTNINNMLDDIQTEMFNVAKHRLNTNTYSVNTYEEMKEKLSKINSKSKPIKNKEENIEDEAQTEFDNALVSNGMNNPGFFLVPWHADDANEEKIKEEVKLTIRCYPFEYNKQPPAEGVKCFYSGKQATHMAIFARNF